MRAQSFFVVLLAGGLFGGLSACSSSRAVDGSAAAGEDFSNCLVRECFASLRYTRLIESETRSDGSERVIYATWSGAIWEKKNSFWDLQQPRYVYFEAQFDVAGSVSDIRVGQPVCNFDNNYQRNCIILAAGEINLAQLK